jgi:RNA polymerase sigma-70 factor (ECF subfamily)
LAAYVFTIARNESNRLAERRKRDPAESTDVAADLLFDEASSDDLSRRETAELVAGALRNLSPNEREVIELKTYAGLTFREIAGVTGSPQGTVATRYRAGLEHLRRALAEQLP